MPPQTQLNCALVQFSHSVVSDSLRPHGQKHARLPCPSPTIGTCSNSCPLSRWCHPAISSSVPPSPPALDLSQHQSLFQWVGFSYQVAKVSELQNHSFQWIVRVDFLQDWLVGSPCSPRDPQESSSTPQFKSINSSVLSSFFMIQLSHPYVTTGKTIALTVQTFVSISLKLSSKELVTSSRSILLFSRNQGIPWWPSG